MKTKSKVINDKLKSYFLMNEEIRILEKQKEELKKEIKAIMKAKTTNVIVGQELAATLSVQFRESLDKKKIEELLGDKIAQFKSITSYDVFKVVRA